MNADQIKHMVDRFLMWPLPRNFTPDNGISYKRPNYAPNVPGPSGTNLLDATQAAAMVRHMVDGLPAVNSHPSAIREAVEQEREAIAEIADEDAMNIRSQIRKVSESDVVNSIDAAAKWNRATALEDFAFCVRARTKDEANG
jgi:hypothetical protein